MHNAFCPSPEAVNPALGRFRAYRLEAGPDLFGVWLVDVIYGHIGTRGLRRRYTTDDEAGARKIIRRTRHRRATVKQRLGVNYCVCEIIDPGQWVRLRKRTELVSTTLNPE